MDRTMLKIPAWPGLVVLLAGLVLVPLPSMAWLSRYPLFAAVLENSAHPVVFAALAWVAGRSVRRPWWVFGLAAFLGGATEVVQSFIGRDASWVDFGNDLLGAGFALSWSAWRARPQRRVWLGVAGLYAGLAVAPMVLTGAAYAHRAAAFPVLWTEGAWLDRPFASLQGLPYPGFSLDEPVADWRGFRSLQVEVVSESDEAITVTLRVHDGAHRFEYTDRYNESFRLAPRSRQVIEVPLSRIAQAPQGRTMDLSDVRGVMLFRQADDAAHTVTVRTIRLVR